MSPVGLLPHCYRFAPNQPDTAAQRCADSCENQYVTSGCVRLIRPRTTFEPEGRRFESVRARKNRQWNRGAAGFLEFPRPNRRPPQAAREFDNLASPRARLDARASGAGVPER